MKCVPKQTSESHHTGRAVLRCERCNRHGLMPPSGVVEHLIAECMAWPYWHELGNWAELVLKSVCITKARWALLAGKNGDCVTCNQNQEAANTLGQRFANWLSGHKLALFLGRIFGALRKYLSPIYRYGRWRSKP